MDKPTKKDSDLVTYLLVSVVSVTAAKKNVSLNLLHTKECTVIL